MTLEKVHHYKYLGVILDENLKFDVCIKTLADSAGRALGSVINKFKRYNSFTKLFNTGVIPILEYGSI